MAPAPADADIERARTLLRDTAMPDWPADPEPAAALGWALKAACYETWNTEPPLAARAAALLRALAAARPLPVLHALADWTAGIAELGAGRMADALAALDRAAAGFEVLGDAQHAAQTQVPKLMALSVLGRHDEALACAEATRTRFLASGDERSAGKIEINLGTLLFRQDRHAEAACHYRSAAERFTRVHDIEQSITADIGLANALTWQFEFDAALRINQQARERADAHGYPVLSAQARGSIGQLELNRGAAHRALPELAAACRLFEQVGSFAQRLAEAEISLADAYLAVNLLPEAAALYDRVIERCTTHDVPTELARARLQRAQVRARLGDTEGAATDLAAARAGFVAQGNLASAALAGLQQAALRLQQGQAEAARAEAEAAATAFEAAGIPGWRCEAGLLAAEAAAAAGAVDAARHGFEAALQSPGASTQTDWRSRVGLAALAHAAGQPEAAQARLDDALGLIEAQQAALPGDEFRTAFGADKAQAYDLQVELALQAHETGPSAARAAALWQAMERARSRALALALGQGEAAPGPEAESLCTRLRWSREQARLALADGDAALHAEHGERARAIERALLEAQRRAQLAAPAAAAADAPPTLAELQAELADDEAWVQYHLLGPCWVAAVVTRAGLRCVQGRAAGLAERLESLRFQLEAQRAGAPALQAHAAQLAERTRRHLAALHTQCWAPLEAALGGRERVVIAPHRALHYLPFAALHDGRHWLVERHQISLAPSARVWRAARRRPAPRFERVLALGVGGPTLPQVAAEARTVAACFGAGATLLLDAQATRAALVAAAPEADLLHLACHAQFRADSPYFSALHLADGELTLRDAAALRLRAGLVTLSACETGLSRVAPGDELLGLVRGFLLAGAASVLATLWTVDDASTAALMQDFYARLGGGAAPAAALRAAQSGAATAGRHPFHWAAFALHGRG